MTVCTEVTVCAECGAVTEILVNPIIPPMCNACGQYIERYGL